MSGKRLIIHLENCDSDAHALRRVISALPEYYRLKPDDGRRLTIRFDSQGVMAIYHDMKDLTLFTQEKQNGR